MQPTTTGLEERVTTLERELKKVKTAVKVAIKEKQQPWWEYLAGRFSNNPVFDELVEAGRAYRQSMTSRTRK